MSKRRLLLHSVLYAGAATGLAALVDLAGLYDYETWEIVASFPVGASVFFLVALLTERIGAS